MKKRYLIAVGVLLILCITLFSITHFSKASILSMEGYFVSGDEVEEVLLSDKKLANSKNVKLEKVSYDDLFYTNLDKLYVGEENKILVNDNFPIYSNKGIAVVNINEKSKLINNNFEYLESYENFTLTGGKLYNYGDLEQADYEDYIFLQLPNGTYVNLYAMKIDTVTFDYEIPLNSIISFEDDYLKYYSYNNSGKLVYNIIDGIDLYSDIIMGENTFTYKKLLSTFGKIEIENEEEVISNEEIILEDNESNSNSNVGEVKYQKPRVSVENFKANVYSAKSKLTINDPAGVIIGGVTFQFKINDKSYLRKTFVSSGNLVIGGLVPDTEFTIIGSYRYYSEDNKKIENTFFEQKIKTSGVDNLKPIELSFENGKVYSDKLEVTNLKIKSNLNDEAVNGVNKLVVYINGDPFSVSTNSLKQILSDKSVTYTTPAKLASNSKINYEFKFLDAFGNEIKTTTSRGVSRTSKKIPSVSISQIDSDVTSITLSVNLKNKDNVNISSYRYVVYDRSMSVVYSKALTNKNDQEIKLDNMDPNATYTIKVLGDFDIEDGNGVIKDNVLGETKFVTANLSSLGYVRVKAGATDITNKSAVLNSYIDTELTSKTLLELINSFTIVVTDKYEDEIFKKIYKDDELSNIASGLKIENLISNLNSGEEYFVNFYVTAKQGNVVEDIPVTCSYKSFKILKEAARVNIKNKFVTDSMIDFDVSITDIEHTILSDRVILEIRDSSENLVTVEYLDVNSDYVQLTYNKLKEKEYYTFSYKVEEYNDGFDNRTFKSDYIIFSETIYTETGIYGSLQLVSLLREIESANLFDLGDYERIRKSGSTGYKDYDLNNNMVKFGARNGWVNFAYYVPEAYETRVVVSFKARYSDTANNNKADAYVSIGSSATKSYHLDDLSSEYKDYSFTINKLNNNYIGFLIYETSGKNTRTDVEFKDIMIVSYNNDSDNDTSSNLDRANSYHKSGYIFNNTMVVAGNEEMPTHNGYDTMLGNSGDGFAKITNLSTRSITTFDYTGGYQTYIVPSDGMYKVELWGAGGGDGTGTAGGDQTVASHGGRGAYTSGLIDLEKNEKLYVYVGGQGIYGKSPKGGYNGGGTGGNNNSGSGGGATDIRLTSGSWDNSDSLKSRIMVAAGGGGADDLNGTLNGVNDGSGGPGGSLTSIGAYINGVLDNRYFASQITGNVFGIGANASINSDTGGAGGGYYGGMVSNHSNGGASGGSSYVSGHAGCIAYHLSTEYVPYKEKNQYLGTFNIEMFDDNNEIGRDIETGEKNFYIRVYRKGELVDTLKYDLGNNKSINFEDKYSFDKNKNYVLKLSVKVRNRYYDISTLEFSTSSEIRTIKTVKDIKNMHTDGKYLVLNDLYTENGVYFSGYFYGEIDFQGYTVHSSLNGKPAYLIDVLGSGGVIKNVVLNYTLNATSPRSFYGLLSNNYGTVDNIMINVLEADNQPHRYFSLGVYNNYGTIRNFVVNAAAKVTCEGQCGLLTRDNNGVIENGYVYGENIDAYQLIDEKNKINKNTGGIVANANTNSVIRNIFSLISVDRESSISLENPAGNIIGYSGTIASILENVYSVEDPSKNNSNLLSQDPNIGGLGGVTRKNVFYSSNTTYISTGSTKISKLALRDKDFQNKVLNSSSAFDIDSYVPYGYYPQVKMNNCMPRQEMIPLLSVSDEDLVDVTSSEQLSVDGSSAEVMLTLNNPGAEEITDIGIQDINKVEIISQENERGKTRLKIKISDPLEYKSKYYIRKISILGAMGYSYERNYEENERGIEVDLYYPINNLNDWKIINTKPNQNYILTTDLDFKDVDITSYIITANFSGKLNGNGHILKNIKITNNYSAFFNGYLNGGTIKNLFVENYEKSSDSHYGAFIYMARNGAVIDNVHMNDVSVYASGELGGLLARAEAIVTIKNSSVSNFKSLTSNISNIMDIKVGALVGYVLNGIIKNTYVQDVDIEITNAMSTHAVGGMVGLFSNGSIENVYATGVIKNNANNTGGLIGNALNVTINKAWTNVDIYSELDYVGGMIGIRNAEKISNTLVTGMVYSSYDGNNINRTIGNSIVIPQNNYAWSKQKYFGYVVGDSIIEKMLSTEELRESSTYYDRLAFGDNFDYSSISNNSLPKLKNCDTGKILPNQKDTILKEENVVVSDIIINEAVSKAELSIVLDNPDLLNIKDIEFDYLHVDQIHGVQTRDGITTMRLTVSPERCYDSYMLTKLYYNDDNGNEKFIIMDVKIDKAFYHQISSVDDWNSIARKNTVENYLLTADLDFAGKTNVATNSRIARLESQGVHTIKNVTINSTTGDFGFIELITKSLKDVIFENITINSTGSRNYVGIIKVNYANISNVTFKNIVINAKSSYVGAIALNRGADLRDITLTGGITKNEETGEDEYSYNIYSTGNYVGGLIGSSDSYDTYNVVVDSIKVSTTGNYVGSVMGYKSHSAPNDFYYRVSNVYVSGKTYVGGVFGYGAALGFVDSSTGEILYSYITNSEVHAIGTGDYVGGFAGQPNHYSLNYMYVENCDVIAENHNKVGGMFGQGDSISNSYVKDVTVIQNNSDRLYVGGFAGYYTSSSTSIGVENTVITSAGRSTGGLYGYFGGTAKYTYTKDVTVNGVDRVGGAVGEVKVGRFYYNVTNSKVNSSGNYVGGIFGYLTDIDPDYDGYSTIVNNVILANTNIFSTGNMVALFAGYTPSNLIDKRFNKILLVGNISASENSTVGIITGYDLEFNSPSMPQFYIYGKSRLIRKNEDTIISSEYIENLTGFNTIIYDSTIDVDKMLPDSTLLRSTDYYSSIINTGDWSFSWNENETEVGVVDGYYPKPKTLANIMPNIELPVESVSYNLRTNAVGTGHELPNVNVYSSGVNTLNIEFDEVDKYTYFEVYENNKKIFGQDLIEKTYSIIYNYTSDLKVFITDGVNKRNYVYKAEDLVNKVSTFDNKYAYIYDGVLTGNIKATDDKYIHIYGDKALTVDLKVYDINKEEYISEFNTFEVSLLSGEIPLHKFEYEEISIDTYATYSIIHRESGDLIFENQIFVKDGVLEIVDSSLDSAKNSIIIDEYANDNYVTILGNDGVIYDLKENIKMPGSFSNKNIKYMSNNINSKSSVIVVMYESGKVVVFDYRTGKKVVEERATEDVSVVEYFKENITNEVSIIGNGVSNYNQSLELMNLLEEKPIVTDNGEYISSDRNGNDKESNDKLDNNYVTYYNVTKDKYDVIDVSEVIHTNSHDLVVENDKIYSSNDLVDFYMQESLIERVFNNVNVIFIFVLILIGILSALGLWFRNIKLLKES